MVQKLWPKAILIEQDRMGETYDVQILYDK